MQRYFNIYKALLRINLANLLAYRANFLNGLIASFVWSSFILVSMILLTSNTKQVFGWKRDELLILSGTYNIVYSIFYMLFARNFEEFSYRIHFGQLDTILLKPVNAQFFLSTWNVGYNNLIRFVNGSWFLLFILSRMHVTISFFQILLFFFVLLFSICIVYSVWFMVMSITVWHSKLSNLVDLMFSVNGVTRYPDGMYKKVSPIFFILFFPLTLVVTTPAKILIQKAQISDICLLIIVAVSMLYISHRFWKYALRFYNSVSS